MYHLTVIMVVYGYTLDRKMSMENTDQREWNPTYLWDNMRRSYPKESVPYLRYLIVIWDVIFILDFSPTLCLLGCHMMSLDMNPLSWWCRTIYVISRGVCLSTTGQLLRSWPHYSMYGILGRPYPKCVLDWFHVWACIIFCRIWCCPSEGLVFICNPLWRLSSIWMKACQVRRLMRWFARWICSYMSAFSCGYVELS